MGFQKLEHSSKEEETRSLVQRNLLSACLFYAHIFQDNIPENTEIFQLSADPDPSTPNNPDFDCDDNATYRFNDRDCFPDLQILILDDDGEPFLFVGVMMTLRTQLHWLCPMTLSGLYMWSMTTVP